MLRIVCVEYARRVFGQLPDQTENMHLVVVIKVAFRLIHDEEPQPGVRGFSVHVYNDGGPDHGFAEIECSLPAVLGEYGRPSCMDTIATWIYVGKEENLKRIGKILLGCEVEFK